MTPPAKLSDLADSIEMASDSESRLYFDRQTGEVVLIDASILSALEEGDEESLADIPGWQKPQIETAKAVLADQAGRFIDPPDRFDFNEYEHMESFIETIRDPDIAEKLFRTIRGSGAFRRFKDSLSLLGLLDRWFRYREQAMKEFVIEWAEENNVPYEDDLKGRGKGH